jgi:predicted O-methyltransferase YrrM
MNQEISRPFPTNYDKIATATLNSGFSMASDPLTGSLLSTLAGSKPGGKFLELGTGTGLSTSWILEGMDPNSFLLSVDNDPEVLNIARKFLGSDERL